MERFTVTPPEAVAAQATVAAVHVPMAPAHTVALAAKQVPAPALCYVKLKNTQKLAKRPIKLFVAKNLFAWT